MAEIFQIISMKKKNVNGTQVFLSLQDGGGGAHLSQIKQDVLGMEHG